MYELIKWENQADCYEVSLNYMPLADISITQSSDANNLYRLDKKSIDVVDLKFDSKVNKADRTDYIASVACGLIAAAFDQFAVGKTDFNQLKDLDKKQLFELAKSMLKNDKFTQQKIDILESDFEAALGAAEDRIHRAASYKALIKDFARNLSIKGLIYSVISKLIGYSFGLDDEGNLRFVPLEDDVLDGKNYIQRIVAGIVYWIVVNASQYAKNGKFEKEKEDILHFQKGLSYVESVIKEVAGSQLFRNKKIDEFDVYKKIMGRVPDIGKDAEDSVPLAGQLSKQIMPIILNKCLVRIFCFVKLLIVELKTHNVKALEGLNFINVDIFTENNRRVLSRMDLVSSGVFAAIDGIEAVAYAAKVAKQAGDEKELEAIRAFISSINIANCLNLVTVVKNDWSYLLEGIHKYVTKEAIAKQKAELKAREIEKKLYFDYVELNSIETRILYSLQLHLINQDIANTKDNDTQILKSEWKDKWIEESNKVIQINRLFDEDDEKVYAMLETHAATAGNKSWLYKIALELLLFTPYYQFDEEDKKYNKLKLSDDSYVSKIFCERQKYVAKNDIEELNKTFRKMLNVLENKTEKTVVGVAGAAAVAAAAGAAAFAFAPGIAVILVGKTFAGLAGAALTNASLAM